MRKKTFKIFVNSFVISLFTMWTFNELFAVPTKESIKEISIPERNISLFFNNNIDVADISATPIETFELSKTELNISAKKSHQKVDSFVSNFDTNKGIIFSKEVSDIPLEYSNEARNLSDIAIYTQETEKKVVDKNIVLSVGDNTQNELSDRSNTPKKTKDFLLDAEKEATKINLLASAIESPLTNSSKTSSAETEIADIIPLEFSCIKDKDTAVEIAQKAPNNQVAMAEGGQVDIESISVTPKMEKEEISGREWHEMREKEENPWVVVQGARYPKNNKILEEKFYSDLNDEQISEILNKKEDEKLEQESIQVAEMVKNILIPIPDDILNDKNLTPQLVSPKKNADGSVKETELEKESIETHDEEEKEGFFRSLTSIFSGSDENTENGEEVISDKKSKKKRRGLFSRFGHRKSTSKILPAEMRLAFQPGRAEISGTTLHWIQAFANKTIEDPNVIIEIRIDQSSSFELQQKRLNLLHNILTNKGVDYEKINTVFTSREPNSFIIRTLRIKEDVINEAQKYNKKQEQYYQSW